MLSDSIAALRGAKSGLRHTTGGTGPRESFFLSSQVSGAKEAAHAAAHGQKDEVHAAAAASLSAAREAAEERVEKMREELAAQKAAAEAEAGKLQAHAVRP